MKVSKFSKIMMVSLMVLSFSGAAFATENTSAPCAQASKRDVKEPAPQVQGEKQAEPAATSAQQAPTQ